MSEKEEENFCDCITKFLSFVENIYSDNKDSKVLSRVRRFSSEFNRANHGDQKEVEKKYAKLFLSAYKECRSKIISMQDPSDSDIKTFIKWLADGSITILHNKEDKLNSIPLSFIARKCITMVKEKNVESNPDLDQELSENNEEELIEMFSIHLFRIFSFVCSDEDDDKITSIVSYLEFVLKLSPGENPDIIGFMSLIIDDISKEIGGKVPNEVKNFLKKGLGRTEREAIRNGVTSFLSMNKKNGNIIEKLISTFSQSDQKGLESIINDPELMDSFIKNPNDEKFKDIGEKAKELSELFSKIHVDSK